MKVAIVGCGNIGNLHAKILSQMEHVEIIGFIDINRERAKACSDNYTNNQAMISDNLERFIKENVIDVLHICTPHYLHVPMAILALKNDIHVFMEKPVATTKQDFIKLKEMISGSNTKIGFCFQNRYNANVKKAKEIIDSNQIGEVINAKWVEFDEVKRMIEDGTLVYSVGKRFEHNNDRLLESLQ